MKGFEGGLQAEQKSGRKPRRIVRFMLSKQPQNMAQKRRVNTMNNPTNNKTNTTTATTKDYTKCTTKEGLPKMAVN